MSHAGHSGGPTADVSVRVAWADDAEAVAAVQSRAWRSAYADLLPAEAIAIDPAMWRAALTKPGDARNRVLVALERATVRGLAVTGPAADPDCDPIRDAELLELIVDPDHRRHGHGSRLLQATVDTVVADKFTRVVTWVNATSDDLRTFLTESGWEADGAHRELDLDGSGETTVKQVRLHTAVA